MKYLKLFILSLIIVSLNISCSKNTEEESNAPRKVVTDNNEKQLTDAGIENGLKHQYPEEKTEPRINIENQDLIAYIQNVNLDFDTEEEQVIIQKDRDVKNKLNLIVVDFDSVRNKYIKTWETVQEKYKSKNIYHILCRYCRGP